MTHYIFITFAPIQSFIEKSRKLRDLYGASLILSYLSQQLIEAAEGENAKVISPGCPNIKKGMPNRILLIGDFSETDAESALRAAWSQVLERCRTWVEDATQKFKPGKYTYTWESEWDKWKGKTWEVFWGTGDSPEEARKDLENRKLARQWTAINWIGESSSISGADAIAYPQMADDGIKIDRRNGKKFPKIDPVLIKEFYHDLAQMFDTHRSEWRQQTENAEVEGKFIADNERLSIPELVKRLITYSSVAKTLGIETPQKFGDIIRRASNTGEDIDGHWTGWFMGDGDKMGDVLQSISKKRGDDGIREFSEIVRRWGVDFQNYFPTKIGRVIYAGGDDFLGVLYSCKPQEPIAPRQAYEWLFELHQKWDKLRQDVETKYGENLTVSVGLVWVAPGVPQRDVLQHCREAEKRSKSLGRDRVTIRVVFNNGQYVQWTTPWKYLNILERYRDLEGVNNWTHIYQDLAYLKSRHAMGFGIDNLDAIENKNKILDYRNSALEFFEVYFGEGKEEIKNNVNTIFKYPENHPQKEIEISKVIVAWIEDLISVGWYLFR